MLQPDRDSLVQSPQSHLHQDFCQKQELVSAWIFMSRQPHCHPRKMMITFIYCYYLLSSRLIAPLSWDFSMNVTFHKHLQKKYKQNNTHTQVVYLYFYSAVFLVTWLVPHGTAPESCHTWIMSHLIYFDKPKKRLSRTTEQIEWPEHRPNVGPAISEEPCDG